MENLARLCLASLEVIKENMLKINYKMMIVFKIKIFIFIFKDK
jgi:hypothetical protein